MTIINVMVDDQRLEFSSMPVVASEGVKETYVKFALSSDWSGFGATALFYRDDSPEDVYTSVLDGAGLAEVPYEITAAPGWIRFGLSGSDGTSVHTSEILKYKVVKGLYTSGQGSEPPAPGIYEQMLAIAGQMRDTLNAAVIEQNAIIQGLVSDMTDLRSDMETEQTTFESVVTGQINTLVNNFAGSSRETILFEGSHTVNIGDEIDLVSDPTVYDYLDIVLNNDMVGTIIGPTQNSQWRVTGETVKSTGTSVTTYVIEGVLDAQSLCLRVSTACAIVDTGTSSTRYDLGSGSIADESLRRYCLKVIGRKLTDDAEVLNIRVGADGVTYQTAGTAVRTQLDKKLNAPISGGTVDYGTSGQLLATDGQGNTEWVDSVVADGSITLAKLATGVIDSTYLIQGAGAESVTTGNRFNQIESDINEITESLEAFVDNSDIITDFNSVSAVNATYYNNKVASWGSITTRAITKRTLFYPVDVTIKASDDYCFGIHDLHQAYTFTGNQNAPGTELTSGWSAEFTVPANTYFIIILAKGSTQRSTVLPENFHDALSIDISPWSLTTLTDAVRNISGDAETALDGVTQLKYKGYIGTSFTLADGGINGDTGANYNGNDAYKLVHKRTPDYLSLTNGARYIIKPSDLPDGTQVGLYRYNASDDSYIAWTGFSDSVIYTATSAEKIRLVFVNNNGNTLIISDIYQNTIFTPYTKVIETVVNSVSVPAYQTPSEFSKTDFYIADSETSRAAQGACTDGTYIYSAWQYSAPNTEIIKIDIETGQVVLSNTGAWGHVNDMCYDATNGYLLTMFSTQRSKMDRIDASTLTTVDSIDFTSVAHGINADYEFVSITYMDDYDRFVFGVANVSTLVGFAFMLNDGSFTLEKFVPILPIGHTTQNIDYINGMIAVSDYNPGNRILYYNLDGQKINEISASYGHEFEAIVHVGNDYYLQYNDNSYTRLAIYKCQPLVYNSTPMALVQSQYRPGV